MLCNIAMLLCYSTLFSLITGALTTFQTYFFKYLYGYKTEEEEDLAGHTYLKEKKELTVRQSQRRTTVARVHKLPESHQTEEKIGTYELEKRKTKQKNPQTV